MDLHWVFPVLLGISIVRGESCSDALYCMHHIDGVRRDLEKEDLFSICSKTMSLVMCVEASIKDCHMKGISIPEVNMAQLSNSILQAKTIYKRYCQDVTPDPNAHRETVERQPFQTVPADASCSDISKCIMDMPAFTDAVSNRRSHEACSRITPSVQCLQSALLDCERSNQLSEDMLNNFRESLAESRSKLKQFCVKYEEEMEAAYIAPTAVAGHGESAKNLNIAMRSFGLLVSLLTFLWMLFQLHTH